MTRPSLHAETTYAVGGPRSAQFTLNVIFLAGPRSAQFTLNVIFLAGPPPKVGAGGRDGAAAKEMVSAETNTKRLTTRLENPKQLKARLLTAKLNRSTPEM